MIGLFRRMFTWIGRLFRAKKEHDEQAAAGAAQGPEPVRIALLGHTATGKTVFYAMLYDHLRRNPEFQMTATDAPTAEYLNRTINLLRGLEDAEDETGRKVTRRVEPKFPPPTLEGGSLSFVVKGKGGASKHIDMMEYAGEAIGLHSIDALSGEQRDFIFKAECVFFMLDATMLDAEVEMEARIESLNILLNSIAGHRDRAGIPLAFIVSKADTLAGFEHEDQAVLVPGAIASTRRAKYDRLRKAVLESDVTKREPVWQESVTRVMDRTARLMRVVLHHADAFQVFFISSIGKPEKSVDEFGATRYLPPRNLRSIGLEEPFGWWAKMHRQRRREIHARRFSKVAGWLALFWIAGALLWHLPFHRSPMQRTLRLYDQGPCEAQLVYRNTFATETLHSRFFDAMGDGIFEQDARTDDWTCIESKTCDEYAQERLDGFGCVADNLQTCEDAETYCIGPVTDLTRELRGEAVAAGAAAEGSAQEASGGTGSRYSQCVGDLRQAMNDRLTAQSSALSVSVAKRFSRLVRNISAAQSGDAAQLDTLGPGIETSLEQILQCSGAAGERDQENDPLEVILGRERAAFVWDVHGTLTAAEPGEQPPLESSDPVVLLQLSKDVGRDLMAHPVSQSTPGMPEGFGGLRTMLEERSFYCLKEFTGCANVKGAPTAELVQPCLDAIQRVRSAGPSRTLVPRINKLEQSAQRRIKELAAKPPPATPPPVAPTQTPTAPPPAQEPVAQGGGLRERVKESAAMRLTFGGFAAGGDIADHLHYRFSRDEAWDPIRNQLWVGMSNQVCVRNGQRIELAASLDQKELTGNIDIQFATVIPWNQWADWLVDNGEPGPGTPIALASGVPVPLGSSGLQVTFTVEAFTEGCP